MSDAFVSTAESSADRGAVDSSLSKAKSRISNGSAFVLGVDGRSAWVRRGKDVESAVISELGGVEVVTAQQRLLVRKIAILETEMNAREQRFAEQGRASDEELLGYATVVNAQRRLLADIGLDRKAKDVTPTLSTYVSHKAAKPSPEEPDDG